jgi:alpha-1,3/alpha-1,6-mannosyltransferase
MRIDNEKLTQWKTGTLDVRVRGNTLVPPSFFSGLYILCAILRQLHMILTICISGELEELKADAFFVDQLSAGLPLLQYIFTDVRILFYCHFPDLLLAKGRAQWWKRAYRIPFDWLEEWSMSFADAIAVNSGFTKGVVSAQWPGLAMKKQLEVVHPCVDTKEKKRAEEENDALVWRDTNILLSINRFEEKKNIGLAIRAFAGLGKRGREGVRLVIAGQCLMSSIIDMHLQNLGGYDMRVQENVIYHQSLILLAESLGLKTATTKNIVTALSIPDNIDVLFLLSVPNTLKDSLLRSARLLIYTPANEHFGIVPLEAMLVGTPVLAANTGGPLETVVEGVTGWLRSPDEVEEWTAVMDKVLHKLSEKELQKISQAGNQRVINEFSEEKMAARLDGMIEKMATVKRRSAAPLALVVFGGLAFPAIMLAVGSWSVLYSRWAL